MEITYLINVEDKSDDEKSKRETELINKKEIIKIMKDWRISKPKKVSYKVLEKAFLYVEEKSQMVYQDIDNFKSVKANEKENFDLVNSDLDLYIDACRQPQNIVYEALGFNNSVSLTINMNELKAFAIDLAVVFLTDNSADFTFFKIFTVSLLAFLVNKFKYVTDPLEKCILKSITELYKRNDKHPTYKGILARCKTKCRRRNKDCDCTLSDKEFKEAMDKLLKNDVIRELKSSDGKTRYTIANLFIKE